jgi:hypothetical protein
MADKLITAAPIYSYLCRRLYIIALLVILYKTIGQLVIIAAVFLALNNTSVSE